MTDVLIVTRHAGLLEWLARRGITGEVIEHVSDPAQVAGKTVFGVLPLHLAAKAERVYTVSMPSMPAEKRGVDIGADEMDEYDARLVGYVVIDDLFLVERGVGEILKRLR